MSDIFKFGDWTVQQLVDSVEKGAIQLPDLQRPFVWPKTKIRDLFDSMYRGYPVGELMFWNVAENGETRSIAGETDRKAAHQIIDGQQRLTSLYAVIKGKPVRDAEYNSKVIRIGFNPFTHKFEVTTPAIERSSQWIANVSDFFAAPLPSRRQFLSRYAASNEPLSELKIDEVEETLGRLDLLKTYLFKVVEIQDVADKKTVADIFVRINSEGVSLKSADFILTWLSVFWPEGRELIENFSRDSRVTAERASEISNSKIIWTPKNHYLAVDAGQLIRVIVAVGQNRAKLADAYNALQAKDRTTGFVNSERQESELSRLQSGVPLVLNKLHWDEFLRCLPAAGFRSRKMVTSDVNLLYCYVLWIVGRTQYGVDLPVLRNLIARWFFMSQLTWRYTGSSETQLQKDLDRLKGLPVKDASSFCEALEGVIASELSEDYWSLRMPDALVTSSASASPAYQTYLAALNVLDADMFMLNSKVRDWMDPTQTVVKGVETHHIFPRNYLESVLGIDDLKRINQVANFAPTDWDTNIFISDRAPGNYWPGLVADRTPIPAHLKKQLDWHALPKDWTALEYDDFLGQRRQLMAQVTKRAYLRLVGDRTVEPYAEVIRSEADFEPADYSLSTLMNAGVLASGSVLIPADSLITGEAEVTEEGEIRIDAHLFDSLDGAAQHLGARLGAGPEFWLIDAAGDRVELSELISAHGATI